MMTTVMLMNIYLFSQSIIFCLIMSFTDLPELKHLANKQAPSAKSFIVPSQQKLVGLK